MKAGWLIIMIIASLAAGCATTDVNQAAGKVSQTDLTLSRDVVLTVHGLSCPLCSNNLSGQLLRVKGVENAAIDLKTGAVSVRLTESHSVTAKDLALAVEEAGFTLKSIEPKPRVIK